MRATRRIFLAAAGAAVAASPANAVATADPVPVSVGIPPGYMGAIVDYAQAVGYFKAAGLDVQTSILNSGAIIATAVAGGSLDFGAVNVGSLASARLRGLPLRIVAPAALIPPGPSGDALLVTKSSPIRTAADLDGKTVAIVALKTIEHAAFLAWLDKHGGDPKGVKMFEMPLPDMVAALDSNRIDAAITVEPFTTKALATERDLTLSVDDALPLPVLTFAICGSEPWLDANTATALKFAGAISAAAVWGKGHDKVPHATHRFHETGASGREGNGTTALGDQSRSGADHTRHQRDGQVQLSRETACAVRHDLATHAVTAQRRYRLNCRLPYRLIRLQTPDSEVII